MTRRGRGVLVALVAVVALVAPWPRRRTRT